MARDVACALVGWALAALVWIGASRVPRSLLSDEVGAEGFPKGLAILLAAVSTLLLLRALWLDRGTARVAAKPEPWLLHARAVGIVAIGFAYVLAGPWLGYAPAAALLIFATAVYYGARPSLALAGICVAGAATLWFVFARLLSVSMPTGIWPRLFG